MVVANPAKTSEAPIGGEGGAYVFPPSWQGLKQQVIYLAQFGDGIQVIEGVAGAGKSTFSLWLSEDPAALVQSVMSLPAAADAQHIFYELLQHLGLRPSVSAGAGALLVMLRSYVQSLHRDGSRSVVLIDDAHLIADSELAALISVIPGETGSGQGLHLILMAEPGFAARIDQLQLLDVAVHDSVLPPLSPSEVETLLAKRADGRSGNSGGIEHARRVWGLTGGIPGRVLALPRDSAGASHSGEPVSDESAISLRGWPIAHFIALIILCCILIWAFLVQRDEPEGAGSRDRASETPAVDIQGAAARGVTRAPAVPIVTVVDTDAEIVDLQPDAVESERLLQNGLGEEGGQHQSETLDFVSEDGSKEEAAATNVSPGLASEIEPVKDDLETEESTEMRREALSAQGEPEVQEASVVDVPTATAANESRQQASTGGLIGTDVIADSEARLLKYPGSAYVLQLMASSAPKSLIEFYEVQPNRDNLMIYRADRDGRILHILVEGFYADKAAAVAAIANLPDKQKKGGPWPKRIQQIQQDISANQRR